MALESFARAQDSVLISQTQLEVTEEPINGDDAGHMLSTLGIRFVGVSQSESICNDHVLILDSDEYSPCRSTDLFKRGDFAGCSGMVVSDTPEPRWKFHQEPYNEPSNFLIAKPRAVDRPKVLPVKQVAPLIDPRLTNVVNLSSLTVGDLKRTPDVERLVLSLAKQAAETKNLQQQVIAKQATSQVPPQSIAEPIRITGERKPRTNFTEQQKSILNSYLQAHRNCPYANNCDVEKLSRETGLTAKQIRTYFTNQRMRKGSGFAKRGVARTIINAYVPMK